MCPADARAVGHCNRLLPWVGQAPIHLQWGIVVCAWAGGLNADADLIENAKSAR